MTECARASRVDDERVFKSDFGILKTPITVYAEQDGNGLWTIEFGVPFTNDYIFNHDFEEGMKQARKFVTDQVNFAKRVMKYVL